MSKQPLLPIESLAQLLKSRFPASQMELDVPKRKRGTWFLDVAYQGHAVVVQWRADAGFGISSSASHAFGEGADEVYQDEEAAYGRVVSLLLSKSQTSPPERVRLAELRRQRGVSQVELAALLKTQQGAVSKLEHRQDMLISTVRDVAESLGGTLQVIVHFADGTQRELQFGDSGNGNGT